MRAAHLAIVLLFAGAAASPSPRGEKRKEKGERIDFSLFSFLPSPAQGSSTCTVVLDSAGRSNFVTPRPGVQHLFAGGFVLMHCKGQKTTMRSDSAAYYQDFDRVDFVGRVHFVDTSVVLDADRASYHMKQEEMDAFQNVKLANRKTGSTLTGTNLIYKRSAPGVRDTSELFARERPRVEYRSEKDSAGAEPYVIIGSTVLMKGDNAAWAQGDVTITRSDFMSSADSAALDLGVGQGHLVGHAKVAGKDSVYQLEGRAIDYRLKDRKITWAESKGLAQAKSSEWLMTSDTMDFTFADDRIQSGSAWGRERKPKAVSSEQSVTADSLVIDAPGQRLKKLTGYRAARATSRDSTMTGEPNWVAGDTVIATFDTTAKGKSFLAHIDSKGNARAYYCVAGDKRANPPGYTYSRGRTIAAELDTAGMQHVYVGGGNVDGVYLEPVAPRVLDSTATAAQRKSADSLNNAVRKSC